MTRFLLVRPGATDFDEQGRLKGTLDIPLSSCGQQQVGQLVQELAGQNLDFMYYSPCECAQRTAEALALARGLKPKVLADLRNIDHGLWHGKLVDEVRQSQPKVYRLWQENAELACAPGGEAVADALQRVTSTIERLNWKHRNKSVGLVTSEPLLTILRAVIQRNPIGDLWKTVCSPAGWQWAEAPATATQVRGA